MSRWQPNARERLEQAAVELFIEQGFAKTTVPQITARAGLTTRTFFRHFADKREVLFASDEEFPLLVEQLVMAAPASLSPMELIIYGLETSAARLEGQHKYLRTRRAVIQTDEALRERELRKRATLAKAIQRGFGMRGYDELNAMLAAQLCVTIFGMTLDRWLDQDDEQALPELLHDTFQAFRAVTAEK